MILKLADKTVGKNYVVLVIASKPKVVRLGLGETGKYDVTFDGIKDIAITLNSIANGKANLTFVQLSNGPKTVATTPAPVATSVLTATPRNWWPIILSALAILVGLGWFIWLFVRRRRKNRLRENDL